MNGLPTVRGSVRFGERAAVSRAVRNGVGAFEMPVTALDTGAAAAGRGNWTGRVRGGGVPVLDRSTGKRSVVDIFETVVIRVTRGGSVGILMRGS